MTLSIYLIICQILCSKILGVIELLIIMKSPKIGGLQCYDVVLTAATSDRIARFRDLKRGDIVRSLVGHPNSIFCLKFNLQSIITSSLDQISRIWDLRIESAVQVRGYSSPIVSLYFDSNKFVVSDGSSQILLFARVNSKKLGL